VVGPGLLQGRWVGLLVAGDGGVDGAGPCVDAAGEGLGVGEALVAEPKGYVEGAGSVMAHDDDGCVRIEFGVGAGGDVAHGDEGGVGEGGGFVLPGFADVQENRGVGLLAQLSEGFGGDFEVKHRSRIYPYRGVQRLVPMGGWIRAMSGAPGVEIFGIRCQVSGNRFWVSGVGSEVGREQDWAGLHPSYVRLYSWNKLNEGR
jgi:hypothetical protein